MGETTETFRLVNEVDGRENLIAEAKYLETIRNSEYELARATAKSGGEYELAEFQTRKYVVSAAAGLSAVEHAMYDVAMASVEVEQKAGRASEATAQVGQRMGQSTAAARGWTTAIQQGGYALGDLGQTSGDLGQKLSSVTNNIQFMTAGLGPWGVAVGVATVAGVSLYRNWDTISNLWEDRTPIDTVSSGLHNLEDQVKKNAAAVDALRAKGSLNLEQLYEWNKLTAEQIDLEAKLSKQREVEAARKAHGADADARSRELGGAFTKAIDELGGVDAVAKGFGTAAAKRMPGGGTDLDRKQLTDQFAERIVEAMKGSQKAMSDLAVEERLDKTGFAPSLANEAAWHDPRNKKSRDWRDKAQEELDKWDADEAKAAAKQNAKIDEGFRKDAGDVQKKRDEEGAKAVKEARELGNKLDKDKKDEKDPALAIAEMKRREAEARRETQTRRDIWEATGGELGKQGTIEAGRRTTELQQKGIETTSAMQEAVAEQMAIMNGQWQRLEFLRARADAILAQTKRMQAEMAKGAAAPTEANAGFGN